MERVYWNQEKQTKADGQGPGLGSETAKKVPNIHDHAVTFRNNAINNSVL